MSNYKIVGKDGEATGLAKLLKSNPKFYQKLMDAFDILGYFDNTIEAEVFSRDKRRGRVDLLLTDKNEDLFIITPRSNSKNDLTIIRKLSGDYDESYDLSIIKKNELTNDNIDLCRTDTIYNTRYGRLISDRKTFVTALFGDNYTYQMLSDFTNPINIEPLISEMNSKEEKPSFKEFVSGIEKSVDPSEIDNILELNCYRNFDKVGSIKVKDLNKEDKAYTKKK